MKNVLLGVCGLSPQVITETLFALHQSGKRVDAIHLITTREGKEKIYGTLLSGESGHYHRYLHEYGHDPASIDFGHNNIHIITDRQGVEISDILNEADNELLLRKCLELTFLFTKDRDNALFFSVAGGRKTMSSCLTLAAQMYGRPQDRIYHVLASPEFESNPDFYYPPRVPKTIKLRDKNGQPFYKETRFAEINLVHLPFVSIRDRLAPEFLKEPLEPTTLMLSLIREEQSKLTLNLVQGKVIFRQMELDLMPARLALYAFFILKKKECALLRESCRECTECFIPMEEILNSQTRISELYQRLCGKRSVEEMSDTGITNLSKENFASYKAKIRGDLQKGFGFYALKDLEIASVGKRPYTRYGIMIDRNKIEIVY